MVEEELYFMTWSFYFLISVFAALFHAACISIVWDSLPLLLIFSNFNRLEWSSWLSWVHAVVKSADNLSVKRICALSESFQDFVFVVNCCPVKVNDLHLFSIVEQNLILCLNSFFEFCVYFIVEVRRLIG